MRQLVEALLKQYEWTLLGDYTDLGAGCWCAVVQTTHLAQRGESEATLYVISNGGAIVPLHSEQLPSLVEWIKSFGVE